MTFEIMRYKRSTKLNCLIIIIAIAALVLFSGCIASAPESPQPAQNASNATARPNTTYIPPPNLTATPQPAATVQQAVNYSFNLVVATLADTENTNTVLVEIPPKEIEGNITLACNGTENSRPPSEEGRKLFILDNVSCTPLSKAYLVFQKNDSGKISVYNISTALPALGGRWNLTVNSTSN